MLFVVHFCGSLRESKKEKKNDVQAFKQVT